MENIIKPDQSDYSVAVRREWVAERYLAHVPPHIIFIEYAKRYQLSKPSFEKDIQHVRSNISVDVAKDYGDIMNDQIMILSDLQQKALKEEHTSTVLDCSKKIVDILKLVTPRQTKTNTVTFNQQNNNVKLPDNLTVDEIKRLLNGGGKIVDIPNE